MSAGYQRNRIGIVIVFNLMAFGKRPGNECFQIPILNDESQEMIQAFSKNSYGSFGGIFQINLFTVVQ